MATQWFYKIDDEVVGPVSSSQLKKLASDNKLTPQTLVRRSSDKAWSKAKKVTGLWLPAVEKTAAAQTAPAKPVVAQSAVSSKKKAPSRIDESPFSNKPKADPEPDGRKFLRKAENVFRFEKKKILFYPNKSVFPFYCLWTNEPVQKLTPITITDAYGYTGDNLIKAASVEVDLPIGETSEEHKASVAKWLGVSEKIGAWVKILAIILFVAALLYLVYAFTLTDALNQRQASTSVVVSIFTVILSPSLWWAGRLISRLEGTGVGRDKRADRDLLGLFMFDGAVVIKGVHPDFLATLPEYPK